LDCQPLDVVLDNTGAVWVTYGLKGKIQQYDAAGSLLKTYDFSDQFTTFGIDVAPDGTLWLSDFNGGLLVNLSSEGEILNSITGLQHPVDIAVAPNGAVYTYAGHPDGSEYPFILKFVPEGTSGEVFGVLPG
jgi:sugar lactone lactonase YvrE